MYAKAAQYSAIVVLLIGAGVLAQDTSQFRKSIPIPDTLKKDGRIFVGPDPENSLHLLHVLEDPQIREEVNVTEEEISVVSKAIENAERRVQRYLVDNRQTANQDEYLALVDERDALADDVFEEVLRPGRQTRLKQLIYRIEVANLGWGKSLTSGRLASRVSVYDDQKEELLRASNAIAERTRQKIIAIKQAAEEEVLELLTPEQRRAAREAVGDFFLYQPESPAQQSARAFEKIIETRKSESAK